VEPLLGKREDRDEPPAHRRTIRPRGHRAFYDEEEFEGRPVIVRYLWSAITPTSAHFEQSFSVDGGANWEPNWVTDQTRVPEPS
jgi:hypothetical protein